jgi:hypothetical protein
MSRCRRGPVRDSVASSMPRDFKSFGNSSLACGPRRASVSSSAGVTPRSCATRKAAAVDLAKFAHFLLVSEPVAEQIDSAFDDRVGLDLGCHGALPEVVNWPSMVEWARRVVAMNQTG